MLSRVANSVYWMSRYIERADNVARFIEVNANLILDMELEKKAAQWNPLVETTGDDNCFNSYYTEYNEKNIISFLTFDQRNYNSILNSIQKARENARTIREVISSEMWEIINTLYHKVEKHSRKTNLDHLQELFLDIHHYNYLFTGLIENTMLHDEAWYFARIGRLLERADKTARILDVKYFLLLPSVEYVDSPYDTIEWGAVLKSVNGFEMYRKHFHQINHKDVSQFLILNEHFPRAISYCINTALRSLLHITKTLKISTPAEKELSKIKENLDKMNIETIISNNLHKFIDNLQFKLNLVDSLLYDSFFNIEKKTHSKRRLKK